MRKEKKIKENKTKQKGSNNGPNETADDIVNQMLDYDCGLMKDYGGGDVQWWFDYLRSEIERCNGFWRIQTKNILEFLDDDLS